MTFFSRQYVDLVAPEVHDAVVAVGMHAKTGSRGFASHTDTLGIEFLINGQTITESELVRYQASYRRGAGGGRSARTAPYFAPNVRVAHFD